ncbi:MAG: HD domain-containing protein [Patescibacteria group bacterium]
MERTLAELEREFEETMDELRINEEGKGSARAFLGVLKQKSEQTYAHSLRVGFLARRIARFLHLDEKALFFAGIFHDLGKSTIPLNTLHKTSGWTAQDTEIMASHVMDSWRLLRDKFDFSADIVLWHHRYQKNPYPIKLPEPLHEYSEGTLELIREYGRILAISDVYDALHRQNDKFGGAQGLSDEQIREKMFEFNPDRKALVEELYNVGILDRGIIPTDMPDDVLYEKAYDCRGTNRRTSRETARLVMLSASLEPVADKAGCTTRFTDISRHLKLEYFLTAAVNLGESFELLAEQAEYARKFRGIRGLYSLIAATQIESLRNRSGGRINQGIIELLFPIVIAQHYFDISRNPSVDDVLEKSTKVLRLTDRVDVDLLIEMKKLAHALCRYNNRPVSVHLEAKNVFEYYSADLTSSTSPTGVAHNGEFVNGFPTVKLMYETIMNSSRHSFVKKVEEAFGRGVSVHHKDVGRGFLADCIAAAIYLCLSQNHKIRLIV